MNEWSEKSFKALNTLHVDLRLICNHMLQIHDCSIIWGHRDKKTQNALYKQKLSKLQWPDSKHNKFLSEAVDLIPYLQGGDPYADPKYATYFSGLVLGASDELYQAGRIQRRIRWGGNWSVKRDKPFADFFDAYHYELEKEK